MNHLIYILVTRGDIHLTTIVIVYTSMPCTYNTSLQLLCYTLKINDVTV